MASQPFLLRLAFLDKARGTVPAKGMAMTNDSSATPKMPNGPLSPTLSPSEGERERPHFPHLWRIKFMGAHSRFLKVLRLAAILLAASATGRAATLPDTLPTNPAPPPCRPFSAPNFFLLTA